MKKTLLSLVSLLLVLAMMFSFAACTGNTAGDDETTPTTAPSGDEPTKAENPEDSKWIDAPGANGDDNLRLPKFDFIDNKVTYLCHYDIEQPDIARENAARDYYNLQWETTIVAASDRVTKFIAMTMGDDVPDVFIYAFMPSLVNKGYCADWSDYIDFSIGLWAGLENSLNAVKYKDGIYTLATNPSRWDPMVWINTALFDEMGVKSPVEYYKEGNWTWDTMVEIHRQMLSDADGDGVPEVYGLGISGDAINSFCYATGKEIVTLNPDGTATNNVLSEEISRAVTFYADLNNNETIYNGNDAKEVFATGKIAMMVGYLWFRTAFPTMIANDDVTFLPVPRDPQADKYYVGENFGGSTLAAKAKNPIGAAALYTASRYDFLNETEDDIYTDEELMDKSNMTNKLQDWLDNEFYTADKYPVIHTWETFELGQYWGDIWFRPLMGEPWSAVAEEIAPKIDETITKVMEG